MAAAGGFQANLEWLIAVWVPRRQLSDSRHTGRYCRCFGHSLIRASNRGDATRVTRWLSMPARHALTAAS